MSLAGEVGRSAGPGCDVGCDVASVAEVAAALQTFGQRYLERVFTLDEIAEAGGQPRRLASRFAAKEAVVKLFRDPTLPTPLRHVEVVGGGGPPTLRLHDELATLAEQRWDDLALTLSASDCHALAVVVAHRR